MKSALVAFAAPLLLALPVAAQSMDSVGGNVTNNEAITSMQDIDQALVSLETAIASAESQLREIGSCHNRNMFYLKSRNNPPRCWNPLNNTYVTP